MDKQFQIVVKTEGTEHFYRGMRCLISFGDWHERETYQATCKSKYRLKSGDTRLKFTGSLVMTVKGF